MFTARFAFRDFAPLQNHPSDVRAARPSYGWRLFDLRKNAISPTARIEISKVATIVKTTAANLAVTAFIR